jgi:hypothetical protein
VDFTAFTIEIGQELTSGGAIWSGGCRGTKSKYFSFCGRFRGGGDATTAIRRCPARSSGTVDIFCHLPSPKRTRIDFGRGDLVWGWQRNKIEVLFVLWSISRGRRRDDGDSQVIDAFVRGGRLILPLDRSKSDKN